MDQISPFLKAKRPCHSCGGRGEMIKNNRECGSCRGKKVSYYNRSFDLRIPSGVPNKYIHKMEGKGSYDPNTKTYADILLMFVHKIDPFYEVDYRTNNVAITIDIGLEDLLCGFSKTISLYNEPYRVASKQYFNPNKTITIKGKGLPVFKQKRNGDLTVRFKVSYNDDKERLVKYHNVFLTMFKRQPQATEENHQGTPMTHFTVQDHLE
jgi:DnaJ-class molecular chaperone